MKGYLIFVEGGNIPHRVHAEKDAAYEEAKRLAHKFPGKEICFLRIEKRLVSEDGEVKSLGSHLPEFDNLNTSNLVPNSKNQFIKRKLEVVIKKPKLAEIPNA